MRILFLLAAMGVAAVGGAAAAQSGAGFARQGAGPSGARAPGSRHHAGGGHFFVRPGMGRGDRRHGRLGYGQYFLDPYGAYGIAGPAADPHGNGFFAGGGGGVRMRDGQPHYDYDRAYPYEWASAATGGTDWAVEGLPGQAPARCTAENGVRVCRGGPGPVR